MSPSTIPKAKRDNVRVFLPVFEDEACCMSYDNKLHLLMSKGFCQPPFTEVSWSMSPQTPPSLSPQVRHFIRLVRKVRPGLDRHYRDATVNLTKVIRELREDPRGCADLQDALRTLIQSCDLTEVFLESGLHLEDSFFSEITKRFEYKVLPKVSTSKDFAAVLRAVFSHDHDAQWVQDVPDNVWHEFFSLFLLLDTDWITLVKPQILHALEVLSIRLAALGSQGFLQERLAAQPLMQSAFIRQNRWLHLFVEGRDMAPKTEEILSVLDDCRSAAEWVRSNRHIYGISLRLTFTLVRIVQTIERMEVLFSLLRLLDSSFQKKEQDLAASSMLSDQTALIQFFKSTVKNEVTRFELRAYLKSNLELLAFQATEYTGKTGEHYITATRSEWESMLISALKGGAIVGLLVVLKQLISSMGLPLAFEALSFGLLYGFGFIAITSVGGTLATKQPAMTASRFASALDQSKTDNQAMENLTEMVVRLIRSQSIALCGNFVVAFPVAALIALPFALIDWPIASSYKSHLFLQNIHPMQSLSVYYAALTGVLLFVSGLLAGGANNWFLFNQIGTRIQHSSWLGKLVSIKNSQRFVSWVETEFGTWVGNMSLGLMLGIIPFLGVIFGLPLDVRHVTFSSGTFGMALASLKFEISVADALFITFGVLTIGLLNLAVSFTLTLLLVIRSRGIQFGSTRLLISKVLGRLRQTPLDFVWPPREMKILPPSSGAPPHVLN